MQQRPSYLYFVSSTEYIVSFFGIISSQTIVLHLYAKSVNHSKIEFYNIDYQIHTQFVKIGIDFVPYERNRNDNVQTSF